MGSRGPSPKRIQERLGHLTKAQKASVDSVRMAGTVRAPAASRDWHPIAARWYRSLRSSGESVYFEPSDWAAAQYVAEAMTRNLEGERFNGQLFSSVWSAMESLLTTEASRRRARVEVERAGPQESEDGPTVLDEYRQMMADS